MTVVSKAWIGTNPFLRCKYRLEVLLIFKEITWICNERCKVTLFSRHNPHFLSPSGSANCKQMQTVYFMNGLSVHNHKVSTETKFKTFCHHSYSFTNSPSPCGKVSCSIPGLSMQYIAIIMFCLILDINCRLLVAGWAVWEKAVNSLSQSQVVPQSCETGQRRSLSIRNSTRQRSLWCLSSHAFRKSSECKAQKARLEPPPGKETLKDGGDTSKANVSMDNEDKGRDTIKGPQPVGDPCWDRDTITAARYSRWTISE